MVRTLVNKEILPDLVWMNFIGPASHVKRYLAFQPTTVFDPI